MLKVKGSLEDSKLDSKKSPTRFLFGGLFKSRSFVNFNLVRGCVDSVHQSSLTNRYFIETNATPAFCSIVSSYSGDLVLVSIQVFLQSDVEVVALRMKEQFLKYGKGKLRLLHDCCDVKFNGNAWLKENSFGIRSAW
ncbi:hypothetical protein PTKIN_Ptkin03bG0081200 [Pterospermum kingtungense]